MFGCGAIGLGVIATSALVKASRIIAVDTNPGKEAWAKKSAGATMIGGGAVYGEDLDKYLRTKVLRMGHMLPLIATGEEDDDS